MFQLMLKEYYNNNINEIETFIFVGDAAGRKKDFSCSDRKFCYNIGYYYDKEFTFKTPEEYFNNKKEEPFDWNEIDKTIIKFDEKIDFIPSNSQEIILFVVPPAYGKSSFYKQYLVWIAYYY